MNGQKDGGADAVTCRAQGRCYARPNALHLGPETRVEIKVETKDLPIVFAIVFTLVSLE